jgi:hypothetical protein
MLDDIVGIRSDALEVAFFSDGFSQSEYSEEWIVQFMSDSGGEGPETASFFGLDELVLEAAVVRCIPEDKADPILSPVPTGHVEPLIVIPPLTNLNLLPVAWFR